ncbi:TPA: hypothetical protein N0F65_012155, partial [Lagenidium giganteum]
PYEPVWVGGCLGGGVGVRCSSFGVINKRKRRGSGGGHEAMWRILEVAKSATANASEYVNTVQAKAQTIVASVQDEAATLLHAIGTARTGPVDEILYEEIDDFKVFSETFAIDAHTEAIAKIMVDDEEISELHEQMVPVQVSYEEFWCRYFFRQQQAVERQRQEQERARQYEEAIKAKQARKHDILLEDFDVDDGDDDDIDEGAEAAQRPDGDDTPLQPALDGEAGQDAQAQEVEAAKKAAAQWKQKAKELQKKLAAFSQRHQEVVTKLQQDNDVQFQTLCDSYESKMAEVTVQIDDARANGFDAGIRESETIIASVRAEAEAEIERMKQQLQSNSGGDSSSGAGAVSDTASSGGDEIKLLRQELAAQKETIELLEEEKTALVAFVDQKDRQLAELHDRMNGTPPTTTEAEGDDSELQHAKEQLRVYEAEIAQWKSLVDQVNSEETVAKLQEEITQLQAQLQEDSAARYALHDQLAAAQRHQSEATELLAAKEQELQALRVTATTTTAATTDGDDATADRLKELVTEQAQWQEERTQLHQQLHAAHGRIQELENQLATARNTSTPSPELEQACTEAKKEMEMWRMRAVKMKKAKEHVDAELAELKTRVASADASPVVGAGVVATLENKIAQLEGQLGAAAHRAEEAYLKGKHEQEATAQQRISELAAEVEAARTKAQAIEKDSYERGVAAGKEAQAKALADLQARLAKSFDDGVAQGHATAQAEVELLKSELAILRAEKSDPVVVPPAPVSAPVPSTLDILADADALLSSAPLSADTALDGVAAPRDDWGEW